MSEVIDSLMPRASNPDTNNPSAATPAAPQQGSQAAGGKMQSVAEKFPLLHELVVGDVKGVYAPKDLQPSPELAALTGPKMIKTLGLGVYRPKDPDVKAVLFNPNKISIKQLQEADKEDRLTKILVPVTKFLSGDSKAAQGAPGAPAAVGDGPVGGLAGQNTPPAAATSSPSPEPVGVLPKPTFGADAQKMAAEMRAKNFAPAGPTAGPIPGGGNILNGLLKRAQ
jgi:hypothetical protein